MTDKEAKETKGLLLIDGAYNTLLIPFDSDDMSKICSIYDNGITWWKNGSEVGNYSLNNTV